MKERLLQMADLYEALVSKKLELPRSPHLNLQFVIDPNKVEFELADYVPDSTKEFSFRLGTVHEKDGEVIEERIDLQLDNILIGHA